MPSAHETKFQRCVMPRFRVASSDGDRSAGGQADVESRWADAVGSTTHCAGVSMWAETACRGGRGVEEGISGPRGVDVEEKAL